MRRNATSAPDGAKQDRIYAMCDAAGSCTGSAAGCAQASRRCRPSSAACRPLQPPVVRCNRRWSPAWHPIVWRCLGDLHRSRLKHAMICAGIFGSSRRSPVFGTIMSGQHLHRPGLQPPPVVCRLLATAARCLLQTLVGAAGSSGTVAAYILCNMHQLNVVATRLRPARDVHGCSVLRDYTTHHHHIGATCARAPPLQHAVASGVGLLFSASACMEGCAHPPSRAVARAAQRHAPLRQPWERTRPGGIGALFMGRLGFRRAGSVACRRGKLGGGSALGRRAVSRTGWASSARR